jgi:hypothetical protein
MIVESSIILKRKRKTLLCLRVFIVLVAAFRDIRRVRNVIVHDIWTVGLSDDYPTKVKPVKIGRKSAAIPKNPRNRRSSSILLIPMSEQKDHSRMTVNCRLAYFQVQPLAAFFPCNIQTGSRGFLASGSFL